jgi:hypothetical protein
MYTYNWYHSTTIIHYVYEQDKYLHCIVNPFALCSPFFLIPFCSPSLTWNPPCCDRIRPPRSQVACKLTLHPLLIFPTLNIYPPISLSPDCPLVSSQLGRESSWRGPNTDWDERYSESTRRGLEQPTALYGPLIISKPWPVFRWSSVVLKVSFDMRGDMKLFHCNFLVTARYFYGLSTCDAIFFIKIEIFWPFFYFLASGTVGVQCLARAKSLALLTFGANIKYLK